ncbi:MAG: hypothetical protein KR126chlam6_00233 [Candidatus Anoxychlamydiales bacterium]|nr:hypothetical protein [Candidatus Anoxychlamydiales bacterium]
MHKFSFLILFLILMSTKIFSNANQYNDCKCPPTEPKTLDKYAYSCPEKTLNDRFYVFGEFLYMQAVEDSLDYAVLNRTRNVTQTAGSEVPDIIPGKRIGFKDNWNYEPGVRAGLGFLNYDLWNAELYWTYVDIDNSSTFHFTDLGVLIPLWSYPEDALNIQNSKDAKAFWNGSFNTLDFKIEKGFYLGEKFLFKPNIGIKAAWINQTYLINMKIQWGAGDPFHDGEFDGNLEFRAVGMKTGLASEFHFLKYLYLYGEAGFSFLHSTFDLEEKIISFSTAEAEHILTQEFKFDTNLPVIEYIAGIGSDFSIREKIKVKLKIGYEMQTWFRQNQFIRAFEQEISVSEPASKDFSLSGLSFRLGFQF